MESVHQFFFIHPALWLVSLIYLYQYITHLLDFYLNGYTEMLVSEYHKTILVPGYGSQIKIKILKILLMSPVFLHSLV